MISDKQFGWLLRLLVLPLPFTLGPALEDLFQTTDGGTFLSIASWTIWTGLLMATFIAHPVGLTALRIGALGAIGALLWSYTEEVSVLATISVVAFAAVSFLHRTTLWCVNGPAYPNERRYPLRPPAPLFFGPLFLTIAVVFGVPVLTWWLATEEMLLAAIAVGLIGVPCAYLLLRSMHTLSRRWLVFVPAGVVLHDPMALLDPVLFQRAAIERFGPADAETDALDLTQAALGTAIEIDLTEKTPMVLVRPFREHEAGASARLMCAPSRPGAVLREAKRRRIPVG